jgi:hypothetical protein
MARARRNPAERLRNAVQALPRHTKEAMLRGVQRNRVIVGAYSDKRGGVCPMLAAHRNGGRTNMGTFARAWDQYTGANAKKPRRASRREVGTLQDYLELALIGDDVDAGRPLTEEVRDVKATRRRLAEAAARDAAEETVDDVLSSTYAAAEERRNEYRAEELLADDALTPERFTGR